MGSFATRHQPSVRRLDKQYSGSHLSTFRPYSGPQMMCAQHIMSTIVTGAYLVISPWLVATGLGEWFGMDVAGNAGELTAALDFMARYPAVWKDVLGFAACGAVGQVFICEFLLPPNHILSSADQLLSLHPFHFLVSTSRHCDGDSKDVHHDSVSTRFRSSPHSNAVARRCACLWRHWC